MSPRFDVGISTRGFPRERARLLASATRAPPPPPPPRRYRSRRADGKRAESGFARAPLLHIEASAAARLRQTRWQPALHRRLLPKPVIAGRMCTRGRFFNRGRLSLANRGRLGFPKFAAYASSAGKRYDVQFSVETLPCLYSCWRTFARESVRAAIGIVCINKRGCGSACSLVKRLFL